MVIFDNNRHLHRNEDVFKGLGSEKLDGAWLGVAINDFVDCRPSKEVSDCDYWNDLAKLCGSYEASKVQLSSKESFLIPHQTLLCVADKCLLEL